MSPTKTAAKQAPKFSDAERAAMRARAKELKQDLDRAEGEKAMRDKIAEMNPADRALGERIRAIIAAAAPELAPKLWYGMPAWHRDGKLVCHFKPAEKFGTRYATLGFSDEAHLDDGNVWPTEFAVSKLTRADEARITQLVKQAVS